MSYKIMVDFNDLSYQFCMVGMNNLYCSNYNLVRLFGWSEDKNKYFILTCLIDDQGWQRNYMKMNKR